MKIALAIEYVLGRLLASSKGRDPWLLINQPAVKNAPNAIEVTCEIGPSYSSFRVEHTGFGNNVFPTINWTPQKSIASAVKEYLVIVEDPDSPVPPSFHEAIHGLFYGIPAGNSQMSHDDLELDGSCRERQAGGVKYTMGGFRVGMNARRSVYGGPRPVCGHGPHRYFFEVIALGVVVDASTMSAVATRAELLRAIEGNVLGQGVWVGVYEYNWD